MTTLDIFISSKMVELKPERDALYKLLPSLDYGDIKLRAWVFEEDAPAAEQSIRQIYLKALQNSALYLGLFWNLYGEWTIDEFDRAGEWGIERHIYVKDVDADQRVPQLADFLNKNGDVQGGLTAKWFKTADELCAAVKASIDAWIVERLRPRSGGSSAIVVQDPDDLTERPRRLIGRDDLLRRTTDLLDKGERVLLTGFGGMGKTALAAETAAKWLTAGKAPLLWLKTGSSPVDALFEALARPFNAAQTLAAQPADARPQFIRALLRQSGIKLLVLDDCWNGPALFALLKAVPSDLPVLVTARQRYSLDNLLDVGQLSPDDALMLLLEHSKGDAIDDARALCKLLGYHAFALEVAGKTLKARKWTPAHLIEQIKDAPHDLKTPADFNERERTSVKDLLDASLSALDDQAKIVFLVCGAFFDTSFTTELLWRYFVGEPEVDDEMLAQVRIDNPHIPAEMPDDQLRRSYQNFLMAQQDTRPLDEVLSRLADSGLIGYIPETADRIAHYRLHDLAYSYSSAQNDADRRSHALDACLLYLQLYNHPSPKTFHKLRPVLDNLLGSSTWAFTVGRYADSEQFTWSLWYGSAILDFDGFYTAARSLLERSAEAARRRGDQEVEGKHIGTLGTTYFSLGEYPRAIEYYEEALKITHAIGDKHGEGNTLGNLGLAFFGLGEYGNAIKYHLSALEIARGIGNKNGEGNALGNLGTVYASLGEYLRAIECYEAVLEIARGIGDKRGESGTLGSLGNAYFSLGEYPRAIAYYEEALKITRVIGDKRGEGNTLGNLGSLYISLGEYGTAIEYHETALKIIRGIGDKSGEGHHLGSLGNAYLSLRDYPRAVQYYKAALEIACTIGDKRGEGNRLANLGSVYFSLEDYSRAMEYHQQALEISRAIGDRQTEGSTLDNLGNTYFRLGHYRHAMEHHQQALEIARAIGDKRGEANHLSNLGTVYDHLGEYTHALDFYGQSRTIYTTLGLLHMVEQVEVYIANTRARMENPPAPDAPE